MEQEPIVFCKGGGCTAKLGPDVLSRVLSQIPKVEDPNLLIGYECVTYGLNRVHRFR